MDGYFLEFGGIGRRWGGVKAYRDGRHRLEIRKWFGHLVPGVIFTLIFFAVWYAIIWLGGDTDRSTQILFSIFPIWFLSDFVRKVRKILRGEITVIETNGGRVRLQGKPVVDVGDIERVQIRTIHDSEDGDEYRLSIVDCNGDKTKIIQTTEKEQASEIAEALADLLDTEIARK